MEMDLNGGGHGGTLILPTNVDARVSGLYWFDVVWNDGTVLSSVPLTISQQARVARSQTTGESSDQA